MSFAVAAGQALRAARHNDRYKWLRRLFARRLSLKGSRRRASSPVDRQGAGWHAAYRRRGRNECAISVSCGGRVSAVSVEFRVRASTRRGLCVRACLPACVCVCVFTRTGGLRCVHVGVRAIITARARAYDS